MISIKHLHVSVEGKPILNGVDLAIHTGELVVLMGPNGSGKSTLAHVLAGLGDYEVTQGSVFFLGEDLLAMEIDERARKGIFLSFQTPVEIPGVSVTDVLLARGVSREEMTKTALELGMDPLFLSRDLGVGASGGEKKRLELLQMKLLDPKICLIDEIDSGLDVDALRRVAAAIDFLRDGHRAFLIITHYRRLLDHLRPDRVVVMQEGKIVREGGEELIHQIEQEGYGDREACEG